MSNIGVIEGFFGREWDWPTRINYARFLKNYGYNFYIYAPKSDTYLRRNWQQDWPPTIKIELARVAAAYQSEGLLWGVGLSPFEIYLNYDSEAIAALDKKLHYLNELRPDIIAILFDDMKGDFNQLASIQADVVARAQQISAASTVIMCPTYYTSDPILDKLFGPRPPDYLESLGKLLDAQVKVFWTGEKVCSKSYSESHLKEVSERLGRKPFLWDNYPVNDGAKMSRFLHLRAFEDRPATIAKWISGHAVNPMNQAYLSQIPLATLGFSYRDKEHYRPQQALEQAAVELCGYEFAAQLLQDLPLFQDIGLDRLEASLKTELIAKYEKFTNPFSREIVAWLKEEYAFSPECLTD